MSSELISFNTPAKPIDIEGELKVAVKDASYSSTNKRFMQLDKTIKGLQSYFSKYCRENNAEKSNAMKVTLEPDNGR